MPAVRYSVPGVYRRSAPRVEALPRVRTDVVGFVGVAGPARLHEAVPVEDWRSYEQIYLRDARGNPVEPPAGACLAETVRAFFTNGGARCWVVNVAEAIEASQRDQLYADLLGLARGSDLPPLPVKRTGLELLALQDEVSVVVVPELDATIPTPRPLDARPLPPVFEQGRFGCCAGLAEPVGDVLHLGEPLAAGPLFTEKEMQEAQRYLIERCGREQWRLFVLLAPPRGKGFVDALRWRDAIAPRAPGSGAPDGSFAAAAFYWPWPLVQPVPGAPVEARSPLGFVAGVYARRDLERGPHAAPANETLLSVVGQETPVDDAVHAQANDAGINVLRSFPGSGIQVWGARTLLCTDRDTLPDRPLGFVNVRRCLSAIERSIERIGQPAVFEPNLPLLRGQVAQAVTSYLMRVFASGALLGRTPAASFFVRCDESNNPAGSVAAGQLLCEVGVAIAAPAEFIVFRVGRSEGVVEIQEVA